MQVKESYMDVEKTLFDLIQTYTIFIKEIELTHSATIKLIDATKHNLITKNKIKSMYFATEEKIRGLIRYSQEKDADFFNISDRIIGIEDTNESTKLFTALNEISCKRVEAQKMLLNVHMLIRSLHECVNSNYTIVEDLKPHYRIVVGAITLVLLLLGTISFFPRGY